MIYLRLDRAPSHKDPVTEYRPVPATVSYTRYPTVGTPNPTATLHTLAQGATAPPLEVPLPRRRRIRAAVLHLDAGLQSRALHHREPGSHRTDSEQVDAAERRAARLDQGNRGRLDQRGSLCGADLHRATASHFLWLSERDGFMHLYLYAQDGTLVKQLTQGDWMIDSSAYNLLTPGRPVHVDPTGTWAYFTRPRAAARWSAGSNASTWLPASCSRSRSKQDSTSRRCQATAATWWTNTPPSTRRRSRRS